MEILRNVEIVGLSLFLKEHSIIVISDLHLGYEEYMNNRGVLIPRLEFTECTNKLLDIIKKTGAKTLVINGDLKHEFGRILKQEYKKISDFVDFARDYLNVIVIKGNHDVILEPILKKKNIVLQDYFSIDNIYICHGHKIPDDKDFEKAKIVIIGNEHPAIALRDSIRSETYKVFLKGLFRDKTLLVIPSFLELTFGTDVLRQKLLSPFLQGNIEDFEVFAIQDFEVFNFGKLVSLKDSFNLAE